MAFSRAVFIIGMFVFCSELTCRASATCSKDGETFEVGTFEDPSDHCNTCECKADTSYSCTPKTCPGTSTDCGENLLENTSDGCCKNCSRRCWSANCKSLPCPAKRRFYPANSCCPECGCKYEGVMIPEGKVSGTCKDCECVVFENTGWSDVYCKKKACSVKLECTNPALDANCNPYCPDGKTCRHGKYHIKYGEFKKIKGMICTCIPDWYPRAFCAQRIKNIDDVMADLMKKYCVADTKEYNAWKLIEQHFSAVTPVSVTPAQPPPLL